MKKLLVFTGILFANSIMVSAQNEKNDNGLQYTIDKQIPSYVGITDRSVLSPKRIILKARHYKIPQLGLLRISKYNIPALYIKWSKRLNK